MRPWARPSTRLEQQVAFLKEIDRLKDVLRRTSLVNRSRAENTAEHSWHVAMMAVVLAEHGPDGTEVFRAVRMLLVHDLVEIDAGDTFAFDAAANRDKDAREQAVAERIFALLPADQARGVRALWDEFERGDTPEAQFAVAGALPNLPPDVQCRLARNILRRWLPDRERSIRIWNWPASRAASAVRAHEAALRAMSDAGPECGASGVAGAPLA